MHDSRVGALARNPAALLAAMHSPKLGRRLLGLAALAMLVGRVRKGKAPVSALDEIIGRTDFDFFPQSLARKYQADDSHVMRTGKTFETTEEHRTKQGAPKIVKTCTYPLTAIECVKTIVTDLAVIDVTARGLVLREVAPGWTAEEVQAATEPALIVSPNLREMFGQ